MPRHKKCRRIWQMPQYCRFGPEGGGEGTVIMTVEEYETLRLIDLEENTQEQCAESMDVARTTVQAIYESARKKAAESIVNGKRLLIEGGDYVIVEELDRRGGGGHGYHGGR
jgi:predicted DNA-binding protein (UPF0251 family)